MQRLTGKTILITGAARGIGEAIARRCASEGARLALFDLREADLQGLAADLAKEFGSECSLHGVDVASLASFQAAVAQVMARFGRIDGLVNNAGIVADAQVHKMSEEQWDRVIAINLKGVYNGVRAVVDILRDQGSGSIVSISSVVGLYGNFGQTNYAAAKAGVIGMTKTWAKELGRKGIRSNAVAPGFISTPILQSIPNEVMAKLEAEVPMRRLGQPAEVAATVAFLLSDDASYVNGSVIEVTGGLTL